MNATYALIIPMVFIILSCREKVCDSKEFSRKNSKPLHESRITRSVKLNLVPILQTKPLKMKSEDQLA